MASFFNPQSAQNGTDSRLVAPATERNRDVILEVLKTALPQNGVIFEVASGTGEHAAHMAPAFPNHQWQPTDIEPHHLNSITAWCENTANILPAQHFNVLENNFDAVCTEGTISAILAINLIHIAPWAVAESLIQKAGKSLSSGGTLYLYGPYKQNGDHTSASNEQFDASLKSRNPAWGIKDMEAVIEYTTKVGFHHPQIIPMPANNFSLIFKKQA